ncbi:efflux RND transporter periplasmic adaptor subunit [Azonexus fungiphilus]|uniref:efflux RND transporter periplasmic adaptor subunit n=1 Tax=Azonexus fungiphilus TaxID=146940 RepID=UPI00156AED15|nr:efflux RND transporter periplasmic adaptor subunit [Azonexus fungiphilus]NHC08295.1 efflux RND transporter periplasmic adaptor subunit [Azonexus fungiphilus]
MSKGAGLSLGVLAVAIAAGGGYWLGGNKNATHEASSTTAAVAAGEPAKKERKLLYYRNPMGLPDTSPVPKKDPMGMDYIPVYEGEQDDEPAAANQIKISVEKVQKLGVRTEAAQMRTLDKVVRAAGRVEPDERRIFAISPKFEGYVERLHVNVTGQPVGKGQPLFEVYSPELVSAQREYAIAAQGVESLKGAGGSAQEGMKQLADSSLLRLKNWDISEEQVKALAKSGEARRTLTFRSPVSGIVTEKKALQGMRFMPGEALYQVADLSAVWVVADVFEQDIGQVKPGAKAKVKINAYPDKIFEGTITYVYPTLKAETRTVPVRVELPNPGQLLKPAMFAQVELPVGAKGEVVTVPTSAIIDSGTRRIVLVQAKEGRFEPREVKLGERSDNYVEVLDGVRSGEPVVVAANFLIDAESNLKAAVGGFGHASHGGSTPKQDAVAAPAGNQEAKPAAVGHKAEGTVEAFDMKAGLVTLNHGPVVSLKWPGMTMEFQVATPALLSGLKPGLSVSFEFVERKPGEWVVTAIKPLASAGPSAAANPHAGH